MAELANQEERVLARRAMVDAGVRNVPVEQRGDARRLPMMTEIAACGGVLIAGVDAAVCRSPAARSISGR